MADTSLHDRIIQVSRVMIKNAAYLMWTLVTWSLATEWKAAMVSIRLGDTSAGPDDCADCLTYVDQLAAALSQDGRRRVRIDDKSSKADRTPSSMPALLKRLRTDHNLRRAVATADVIVLARGSGDVTPRSAAARCRPGHGTRCPKVTISLFRYNLIAWIAETDHLHRHDPLDLRIITSPPTSGSPRQNDVARTACQIAATYRAGCVNTYSLARTDEHITADKTDPRQPQLTQHGHDLVATDLIAIGLP